MAARAVGQVLGGAYNAPTTSTILGTTTLVFTSQTTATLTPPNGSSVALTRYTF
jgi:hypothetical protein